MADNNLNIENKLNQDLRLTTALTEATAPSEPTASKEPTTSQETPAPTWDEIDREIAFAKKKFSESGTSLGIHKLRLHIASYLGLTDTVRKILILDRSQVNHFVNDYQCPIMSPLMYALQGRNWEIPISIEIVKMLLAAGAETTHAYLSKDTPLHYAVYRASSEGIRLVLMHGGKALLEATNKKGNTPLVELLVSEYPSDQEKRESLNELILAGVNVNNPVYSKVETHLSSHALNEPKTLYPIHFAAKDCDTKIILALVEAGANIEVNTSDMETPIKIALAIGKFDTARLFVNLGALETETLDFYDESVTIDPHFYQHIELSEALLPCLSTENIQRLIDQNQQIFTEASGENELQTVARFFLGKLDTFAEGLIKEYKQQIMACLIEKQLQTKIKEISADLANHGLEKLSHLKEILEQTQKRDQEIFTALKENLLVRIYHQVLPKYFRERQQALLSKQESSKINEESSMTKLEKPTLPLRFSPNQSPLALNLCPLAPPSTIEHIKKNTHVLAHKLEALFGVGTSKKRTGGK